MYIPLQPYDLALGSAQPRRIQHFCGGDGIMRIYRVGCVSSQGFLQLLIELRPAAALRSHGFTLLSLFEATPAILGLDTPTLAFGFGREPCERGGFLAIQTFDTVT